MKNIIPKYDKLKFNCSKAEGEFEWGKNRYELFQRFYDADEILEKDIAESEFKMIIKDDPEFIDAYNSLGWLEIDVKNFGNSLKHFSNAFRIGNTLIPKNFDGKIIWGVIDNRPFLRSLQGLGVTYIFINEFEKALFYLEKNLKYNPNDNQGIRSLAIHCYIALGEFNKVLKLCKSFPDDALAETQFGMVLANYKLAKYKEAEESLKDTLKWHPLVAEELISKKHKEVKSEFRATITLGGEDEAYEYWKMMGQFWTGRELKQFIKTGLEKYSKIKTA
jgi:tetratricopeptide (TPR) repeat protein